MNIFEQASELRAWIKCCKSNANLAKWSLLMYQTICKVKVATWRSCRSILNEGESTTLEFWSGAKYSELIPIGSVVSTWASLCNTHVSYLPREQTYSSSLHCQGLVSPDMWINIYKSSAYCTWVIYFNINLAYLLIICAIKKTTQ